jgi:hypothetical protein
LKTIYFFISRAVVLSYKHAKKSENAPYFADAGASAVWKQSG